MRLIRWVLSVIGKPQCYNKKKLKQDGDMSLENIVNWMWSTNILIVFGVIVLVIIGFSFLEAILSFIFSKWILIVIALIALFLVSNYYF